MAASPSRYERTRCLRRGWAFERSGWVAMAAVVAGAALGLFGDGWLSATKRSSGEALLVEFPRFCRAHAPLEVTVDWVPGRHEATLWVARSYLDAFSIEEVRPEPTTVSVDHARVHYLFRTLEPDASVRVTFRLKPEQGGRVLGRIGSSDGTAVEIRQLVFP